MSSFLLIKTIWLEIKKENYKINLPGSKMHAGFHFKTKPSFKRQDTFGLAQRGLGIIYDYFMFSGTHFEIKDVKKTKDYS